MITEDDVMVDRVIFDYIMLELAEDYNKPVGYLIDIVEGMTLRGYSAIFTVTRQPGSNGRKIDFGSVKLPHGLTDEHRETFSEWIAETTEERRSYLTEGDVKINDLLALVRSWLN